MLRELSGALVTFQDKKFPAVLRPALHSLVTQGFKLGVGTWWSFYELISEELPYTKFSCRVSFLLLTWSLLD